MRRQTFVVVVVVLGIVALGAAVVAAVALRELAADSSSAPAVDKGYRGSEPPVALPLPEFRLRDESGRTVTTENVRDVVVVTFLDTQCTEACPVIASHVARGVGLLSAGERERVTAIGITVDPSEDTPSAVRSFLRRNQALGTVSYLTGPERTLRDVWREFGVLPSVTTGRDDMHSAPVRIFDHRRVWVSTLHAGVDLTPTNLAHDVRLALAETT